MGAPVRSAISAAPGRKGPIRPGGPADRALRHLDEDAAVPSDRPRRRHVVVHADAAAPDRQQPAEPVDQALPPARGEGRGAAAQEPGPGLQGQARGARGTGPSSPGGQPRPGGSRRRGRCSWPDVVTRNRKTPKTGRTGRPAAGTGRAACLDSGVAPQPVEALAGASPRPACELIRGQAGWWPATNRPRAARPGGRERGPASSTARGRRLRRPGARRPTVGLGSSVAPRRVRVLAVDALDGGLGPSSTSAYRSVSPWSPAARPAVAVRGTRPVPDARPRGRRDDEHRDDDGHGNAAERPVARPQRLEQEADRGVPDQPDRNRSPGRSRRADGAPARAADRARMPQHRLVEEERVEAGRRQRVGARTARRRRGGRSRWRCPRAGPSAARRAPG